MREYEILVEWFGGIVTEDGRMRQELIEAELSDPREYIAEHDPWPVYEYIPLSGGDVVIVTKSGDGNIRKYTFMKC